MKFDLPTIIPRATNLDQLTTPFTHEEIDNVVKAELLQGAVNDAFRRGDISLPLPCNGQNDYLVIQYADDTLLVLPACPQQATRVKNILSDYASSIGLKINFHKSMLIPINLDASTTTSLAAIFGCNVGTMPFTYLGLPLGTTKPTIQEFMPLVCKMEHRLTATIAMMSYGGRLSWLNASVTSLLVFAMCTLKFPPKLIEILDKIRRRCLWTKKTDQGDKCNSLASWELVCKPKSKGGLGVINITIHNDALLLKFLHKFYNKLDVPWVTMLWDNQYVHQVPHAVDFVGSFWWKDILKLTPIYRGITRVQVVDGSTTLLWKDLWSNDVLQSSHPRALSFVLHEDMTVAEFWANTELHETFHLPLSARALNEVQDVQHAASNIHPSTTISDVWHYT
ncbi:uncharacterized protein [Aegilops tauschii subsp. strangulata]|uniref:uncharacterized protein n=1 Tax=Aegilops tauschii subsp. strangulata TaxID=200361 RepID=UPI003CC8DC9B